MKALKSFVVLLPALATVAACSKAPPEPISKVPEVTVATTATTAQTTAAKPIAKPNRCTKALPANAPPAVGPAKASDCPKDPEGGQPMVPVKAIRFYEAVAQGRDANSAGDGQGKQSAAIEAEIVGEGPLSERGLMYRLSMPTDHGMLFDLNPSVHTFWMHNTCLPLDMVFADADGYISGILENVPTLNDEPRTVGCEGRYVLETNAGWTRAHGIKPGMFLKVE